MRRRDVLAGGAALAATGLARPAIGQGRDRVLRFVPQANLANPDPIWTTATVAHIHGYMVWDLLYGVDESLDPKPQMVAGHEILDNGLTWRLTLREGLLFHDNEPVRAIDCTTSINRWARRNPFGQRLLEETNEMRALDDRRLEIRLKKPFPMLPYALGATGCFIMPERMARTDPFAQVQEYVGSGPYRFLRDEWVSGASAAYARWDKYVPRQEPPSLWAGGKVTHFDRVEWKIMPDPATAAGALKQGEIDWWEQPLIDLVPDLKASSGVKVEVLDQLGVLAMMAFNHLHPPFDNLKLRQAVLSAVDQQDFIDAVLGEQAGSLGRTGVGVWAPSSPLASEAGMAALTGRRDLEAAKRAVAASGYKGEPVLLMSPSDQPQPQVLAQVTDALFKSLGINSQYTVMDWGTLVARRASKEPAAQGGWNSFCTTWAGLSVANPGSHFPLRGNGPGGWFGWPTDPDMERLRDAWFDAPDLAAQKRVADAMQVRAFERVPFIPLGAWFNPTAYRTNLTGFVRSLTPLMWGVRRA